MPQKNQKELLEEFSQEIDQMSGEDIMKGIYDELLRERMEPADIQFLKTNNSAPAKKHSNWIDQRPGEDFMKKYNDSPAL